MKYRALKIKTVIQTELAKSAYVFNRRVKGVKTFYNLRYSFYGKYSTVDVMSPSGGKDLPCIVYFHGGGWMTYDKSLFRSEAKHFAAEGAVVFNCNYRLAPRYSVADMEKDVAAAVDFAVSTAGSYGGNPKKIILAGDSSGAHLAALFINKLARGKYDDNSVLNNICGQILFYGVFDLVTAKNTGFKNINTYLNGIADSKTCGYDRRLQKLSPVNYIMPGLPPALICSGAIDKLHNSQSRTYSEKLRVCGNVVEELFFDAKDKTAKHKFITFDFNRAAKTAVNRVGDFLNNICLTDRSDEKNDVFITETGIAAADG